MPVPNRNNLWWMVAKPRYRAVLRLVCFPFAGGTAAAFQEWHAYLPPEVEVIGVQLPGRAQRIRETPYLRVHQLIPDLAAGLLPVLDMPFAFFGHSMGAILAFEVTRWLRQHGRELPHHLFVSAHRAPQVPLSRPEFHKMSDTDLIAQLSELNGIPEDVLAHRELLDLVIPTVRADCEIDETYRYHDRVPLDCPITVFSGLEDLTVEGMPEDWCIHTRGQFARQLVPGGHFFINTHRDQVLSWVADALKQVTETPQRTVEKAVY